MKKDPAQRYKEKQCPVCGITHKKRWPCCSYACSHELKKGVKKTEEQKKAISDSLKEWKKTEKGQLTNMNLIPMWGEEDLVLPPVQDDTSFFVEDDDVWSPI
jgi:hypothetical protein